MRPVTPADPFVDARPRVAEFSEARWAVGASVIDASAYPDVADLFRDNIRGFYFDLLGPAFERSR